MTMKHTCAGVKSPAMIMTRSGVRLLCFYNHNDIAIKLWTVALSNFEQTMKHESSGRESGGCFCKIVFCSFDISRIVVSGCSVFLSRR